MYKKLALIRNAKQRQNPTTATGKLNFGLNLHNRVEAVSINDPQNQLKKSLHALSSAENPFPFLSIFYCFSVSVLM